MSAIALKVCNVVALCANLWMNKFVGKRIGGMARAYDHVALPAGPAFAIWGIIYCWEIVFSIWQFFATDFDSILFSLTPWFCIGQLMQGSCCIAYVQTDPEKVGKGGDAWVWGSSIWLILTAPVFQQATAALVPATGVAYWVTLGITANTAWVILAAGLGVNQMGRAAGLEGRALSAVAMIVLISTLVLELFITGFIGKNPYNSPKAYLVVGIWGLFWIFQNLKGIPSEEASEHEQRILPLYGSRFVVFYKWCVVAIAIVFAVLEAVMIFS